MYPSTSPSDPDNVIRLRPVPETTRVFDNISDIRTGAGLNYRGECLIDEQPAIHLIVERLWPDSPTQNGEILRIFGPNALDWWSGLSLDERRRRTEAAGLNFLEPTATQAEIDAELQQRAADYTEEIVCNVGSEVWCRWTPTRSGFFALTVTGAWYLQKSGGHRVWWNSSRLAPVENYLAGLSASERQSLERTITRMGYTPAEMGINSTLDSLLPRNSSVADWHYSAASGVNSLCPPPDLRVHCSGGSDTANYTETEPVGVLVHEMHVATRLANS